MARTIEKVIDDFELVKSGMFEAYLDDNQIKKYKISGNTSYLLKKVCVESVQVDSDYWIEVNDLVYDRGEIIV